MTIPRSSPETTAPMTSREELLTIADYIEREQSRGVDIRLSDVEAEKIVATLRAPPQTGRDLFMDDYKHDTIKGLIEKCADIAETFSEQGRDGHQIARAIRNLCSVPSTDRGGK